MDVRTLRQLAAYSQREAARAAGVSVRTWRRWERADAPPPLVLRWLRYEVGIMPGWPPGWRLERGALRTPHGDQVPPSVIEAARWVLGLLEGRDRERAYAIARTSPSPPPGSPALHRSPR